jgi:Holliday junction resolvase
LGRSEQRKGADGERELVSIIQQSGYQVECGGSETYGEIPDIVGLKGIHIECKRVEKLNIQTAMDQAVRDSKRFRDGAPTVFHRRNREPWMVTMLYDDWMRLYKGELLR